MGDITGTREDDSNVFKINVTDGDQALAAMRDVPRLYTTGGDIGSDCYCCGDSNWEGRMHTFLVTGFPRTKAPIYYTPQLVEGQPGSVGAVYSWEFPVGEQEFCAPAKRIRVRTEITDVVDLADYKKVAFRHENEGMNVPTLGMGICDIPQVIVPETSTRIEIFLNERGMWDVSIGYKGLSADPREHRGCANYWCEKATTTIICPIFLPLLPCIVEEDFTLMTPDVQDQMMRIRAYAGSYTPAISANNIHQDSLVPKGVETFKRGLREGTVVAEPKSGKPKKRTPDIKRKPDMKRKPDVKRFQDMQRNPNVQIQAFEAEAGEVEPLHEQKASLDDQ